MYQFFGLRTLLQCYVVLCFLVALPCLYLLGSPSGVWDFWRLVSVACAISGALLWGLGQTSAFPFICRLPPLQSWFPDIDGKWKGAICSNWPIVSELLNSQKTEQLPKFCSIPVSVRIKVRLFFVNVHLTSPDDYSKSHTIVVGVQKSPAGDGIRLSYIYENETTVPLPTDSGKHLGAAYLDLVTEEGRQVLKGHYWTDRNWTKGLNTAGTIQLAREELGPPQKPDASPGVGTHVGT